jgi:hypothetical protein
MESGTSHIRNKSGKNSTVKFGDMKFGSWEVGNVYTPSALSVVARE